MDSPPSAEQQIEDGADLMSIHSPINKMPPDDDDELLLLNNRKNSETTAAEKIEENGHRRNSQITGTIVPKTPPWTLAAIGMHSDGLCELMDLRESEGFAQFLNSFQRIPSVPTLTDGRAPPWMAMKRAEAARNSSEFYNSQMGDLIYWHFSSGSARLQELEAEQQRLGESMLALSTQFAQIQFRIQQIAQAPTEQRDVSAGGGNGMEWHSSSIWPKSPHRIC